MDGAVGREAVDALVRSARDNGFTSLRLKYAGGEVSLRGDEVLELHDHAVERTAQEGIGLSAVLLSNGVVLREPLARGLLQRDIKVMISLDGIGEAHDELRPT
jgi:uncharacterized protein